VVWQAKDRCMRLLNVLVEPPSTVSREVARNGGHDTYRAHQADPGSVSGSSPPEILPVGIFVRLFVESRGTLKRALTQHLRTR